MNFGFVILYVNDMDQAKGFYRDVMGMPILAHIGDANFVVFRPASGSLIALQNNATAQFEPRFEKSGGSVELSFEVDDVDGTWQRWQEHGVEMVSEPMDLPFGRYFIAKDTEGHYLSVYKFAEQRDYSTESAAQKS